MQGSLHPSLRAYIDCFDSAPFPKMWPRGGGIWDQDPVLVNHFRIIRDFEVQWKQNEGKLEQVGNQPTSGGGNLEDLLENYLEEIGESGTF